MREYELLSRLFEYPDDNYKEIVIKTADSLEDKYPEASNELREFYKLLPDDVYAMQELYTKSFEVQAVTSLEIGYVLYGDDYTRGEVLANLSAEHKAVGNECGQELADHLSNVLRLIPKIKDKELLNDFGYSNGSPCS